MDHYSAFDKNSQEVKSYDFNGIQTIFRELESLGSSPESAFKRDQAHMALSALGVSPVFRPEPVSELEKIVIAAEWLAKTNQRDVIGGITKSHPVFEAIFHSRSFKLITRDSNHAMAYARQHLLSVTAEQLVASARLSPAKQVELNLCQPATLKIRAKSKGVLGKAMLVSNLELVKAAKLVERVTGGKIEKSALYDSVAQLSKSDKKKIKSNVKTKPCSKTHLLKAYAGRLQAIDGNKVALTVHLKGTHESPQKPMRAIKDRLQQLDPACLLFGSLEIGESSGYHLHIAAVTTATAVQVKDRIKGMKQNRETFARGGRPPVQAEFVYSLSGWSDYFGKNTATTAKIWAMQAVKSAGKREAKLDK